MIALLRVTARVQLKVLTTKDTKITKFFTDRVAFFVCFVILVVLTWNGRRFGRNAINIDFLFVSH